MLFVQCIHRALALPFFESTCHEPKDAAQPRLQFHEPARGRVVALLGAHDGRLGALEKQPAQVGVARLVRRPRLALTPLEFWLGMMIFCRASR